MDGPLARLPLAYVPTLRGHSKEVLDPSAAQPTHRTDRQTDRQTCTVDQMNEAKRARWSQHVLHVPVTDSVRACVHFSCGMCTIDR